MNSQPRNSYAPKYSGSIQTLLDFAGCLELSQVTPEHLDRFASQAPPKQRMRLFSLWTGAHDPTPELEAVVAEILK